MGLNWDNPILDPLALQNLDNRLLMLSLIKMYSVNQLNAQIKLLEIWKALNVVDHPLKIEQQSRACLGRPCEIGKTTLTQNTCVSDFGIRSHIV